MGDDPNKPARKYRKDEQAVEDKTKSDKRELAYSGEL